MGALYSFVLIILCFCIFSSSRIATSASEDYSEIDWSLLEPITSENITQLINLYCVKLGEGTIYNIDSFFDEQALHIAATTSNDELYLLKVYPSHVDTILLGAYGEPIRDVALSPAGDLLAASVNRVGIEVLDVNSEEKISILGETRTFHSVTFHPITLAIITAEFDQIFQWDLDTGSETTLFDLIGLKIKSLSFSPSSSKLAIGHIAGAFLIDWQDTQETPISRIDIPFVSFSGAYAADVQFNEDGTAIAYTSDGDEEVGLWNVAEQNLITIIDSISPVYGYDVAFNGDGQLLLVATSEGVKVHHGVTGDFISSLGHRSQVKVFWKKSSRKTVCFCTFQGS